MIKHGGNLGEAAIKYGIAKDKWLDLSTGINPNPWVAAEQVPESVYHTLPHPDATFYSVASQYYQTDELLAVPGSQSAIQALPRLMVNKVVAIPVPGYEEHYYQWQQNNHQVVSYDPDTVDLLAFVNQHQPDIVIVINPNNPSCKLFNKSELLKVLKLMEKRNGLLVVDEAFLDTRNQHSLLQVSSVHLIVLRSIGKFFGLPGIRMGFVKADIKWRQPLEEYLGAWPHTGAGLWITTHCLADSCWQQKIQQILKIDSQQLADYLSTLFPDNQSISSTDYFASYRTTTKEAHIIQDFYAQHGILVRLIELPHGNKQDDAIIRIGLCRNTATEQERDQIHYFKQITHKLSQHLGWSLRGVDAELRGCQ